MVLDAVRVGARFKIHVRCAGCHKVTVHRLEVPDVEDAPLDEEALQESAFLQQQRFICGKCESSIGTVICTNQVAV